MKAGHQIAISNSKGPQSLESLISSIGANAKATVWIYGCASAVCCSLELVAAKQDNASMADVAETVAFTVASSCRKRSLC